MASLKTVGIDFDEMIWPRFIYTRLFVLGLPYPLIGGGCSLQRPPQEQRIRNVGYFQFQAPQEHMKGVVIGAPRGIIEPGSEEYARSISERTGAGHTAELVERFSYRTALPAVVPKGCSPTQFEDEIGIGWNFRKLLI